MSKSGGAKTDFFCQTCGEDEFSHEEMMGWVQCLLCGERSMQGCSGVGEDHTGPWSCKKCQNTMVKLRSFLSDQNSKPNKEGQRQIEHLEKELRMWKSKMGDKNDELARRSRHIRQLEQRLDGMRTPDNQMMAMQQRIAELESRLASGPAAAAVLQSTYNSLMGGGDLQQLGHASMSANGFNDMGVMDIMRKRPANDMEAGGMDNPPMRKRRATSSGGGPVKQERVLWVVDNILRGLVMNQRFQVEFYKRGYDCRLIRGGNSDQLLDALEHEVANHNYQHVIFCAGAIDLEQALKQGRSDEVDSAKDRWVANMEKAVQACANKGVEAWVIVPPPRRHGDPFERQQWTLALQQALHGAWNAHIMRLEMSQQDDEFIREKLFDGIHIRQEWEVPLVESILRHVGLPDIVPSEELFAKEEVFGPQCCWRCGMEHRRSETPCAKYDNCALCGDKGHHKTVCLYRAKMCQTCGRRGHGPDKCKQRY